MARLFRSKSCSFALNSASPPTPSLFQNTPEDDEEEDDDDDDDDEGYFGSKSTPATTPFIGPQDRTHRDRNAVKNKTTHNTNQYQFPILALLGAALRKSLVTCSVERDDVSNMDIGWPTEVRHVSHVTFDPFNGFLGLPVELQPDLPRKVPSARFHPLSTNSFFICRFLLEFLTLLLPILCFLLSGSDFKHLPASSFFQYFF